MSRIHEALKRAEAELKTSAHVPDTPDEITSFDKFHVEDAGLLAPAALEDLPATANSSIEGSDSGGLLSKVRTSLWSVNPQKILFADQNLHNEPGMEEFRTLRSRLYQAREKRPLKTVMISSALPGEGKTFITSNLAFALARQQGRRVLLIDADIRKPFMHECIGAEGTPGLNDYLAGNVDEQAILQRGQFENLYFVPGGKAISNPSELIAGDKLRRLLTTIAPHFDWILLDSPPIVPITDGALIARCVDGVALVVRSATTPVNVVQRAKQELKNLPLLGVVLNWGEKNSGYSSYYYSYGSASR